MALNQKHHQPAVCALLRSGGGRTLVGYNKQAHRDDWSVGK